MTLYQMSFVYREDALRFRMRDSSGAFWSSSSFSASRASWPS